ncbi:MAG TPA: hypothetical protein VGF60_21815, partial [Xanthobacteraceae bacterium]
MIRAASGAGRAARAPVLLACALLLLMIGAGRPVLADPPDQPDAGATADDEFSRQLGELKKTFAD